MAKTPGGPNDADRFAQLIKDEYGVDVDGPGLAEDAIHARAKTAARRSRRTRKPRRNFAPGQGADWFSLDQAIEAAEPEYEPWERFKPPDGPPLARPHSKLAIAGVAALLVAIGIAVAWLAGAPLPMWLRGLGGLAVGAGLVCLLLSIPRHRQRDYLDGDGAVL